MRRRPILLAALVLGLLPATYVGLVWLGALTERWVRFERPLAAFPVAVAVAFVAWRLLRLPGSQGAVRRAFTELLLAASALAAAYAVIGVELGRPLDRMAVLIAVDKSRSMELVPNAADRVRAELQVAELGMREDDRIGTLAFAAEAVVEDPLRLRTRLPAPQQAELGRDGTDIGAAIRRALAEVPADSAARIVLVSDGVSTRGDPLGAAAAAVAAGVPIDAVPLDQSRVPDVRLVGVRMPSRASEGEALELRIVTASSTAARVELRVRRDGELVRRGTADVAKGEDVLVLREVAPGPGLHRYDVELSALDAAHDQAPDDNAGAAFVRVRGQALALVLERDPAVAGALVRALETAAFATATAGPGGAPADVAELAAYDLVVLSDVPAADLAPTQIDALATYARDLGGGLLLMGGDRSLGPGGWGKTPVEEVSPVSFDLKQERRRASLAEIIAIDYSGSMAMQVGRRTKLELANEAAVRSASLLGEGDRLAVLHVDTVVKWTVPLGPVNDEAQIARAIRGVGPGGGGIYVDLTLRAAYEALHKEKTNLKHLLLFADGDDAEERAHAFSLVTTAKQRGITTSVVALGRGADVSALEQMSRLGDGRFYLIEDASRLPSVFAQETILASRSAINELSFRAAAGAPGPPTRGVDLAAAPPLTGYVVTVPKGRAQVHLLAAEGDPLLATWSVGVGRAGVFTSDYKDRWGQAWTSWEGAARLFGQLGRDLARRADDPRVRLEADAAGGELHVRATIVDDDGRTESFRRLRLRVGGPDGFGRDVALDAVGAGAYAATVPLSRPGAYVVTAIDEASGEAVGTTGAALMAGEELRPTGSDRALLRRVSELTGGKLRDTLAGIFQERPARRFAYRSLSSLFLLISAFALLGSVAARRLAVPESWASLPARLRMRRDERRKQRRQALEERIAAEARRGHALDALRDVKARTAVRAPPADAPPPSLPRFAPLAPARPPAAAEPLPPAQPPAPAAPGAHKLSAAEILLARRRGRRG